MNSLIELKKAFKIIDFKGFCLFSDPAGIRTLSENQRLSNIKGCF